MLRLLLFALVLVLALLYYRQAQNLGLRLEVEIPQNIVVMEDMQELALPVRLNIINDSDTTIPLTAENKCLLFRWVIVGAQGRFVQAKGKEPCADTSPIQLDIPPHSQHEIYELLPLNLQRYHQDENYEIHLRLGEGGEGAESLSAQQPFQLNWQSQQ